MGPVDQPRCPVGVAQSAGPTEEPEMLLWNLVEDSQEPELPTKIDVGKKVPAQVRV